jgi:chromosome segregation ATPase
LGIGGIVTEMTKDRSNEPATGNDLVRLANSIDLNFSLVSNEFVLIRQEFVSVRQEIAVLRQEVQVLRQEVAVLQQEMAVLRQEIVELRHEIRNEMREFKLETRELINGMFVKLIVINTAFLSLVVAIGGVAIALA